VAPPQAQPHIERSPVSGRAPTLWATRRMPLNSARPPARPFSGRAVTEIQLPNANAEIEPMPTTRGVMAAQGMHDGSE